MNKADIFTDTGTNEIVVVDKSGKEVFRKEKNRQTKAIASDIYFYHKYNKGAD